MTPVDAAWQEVRHGSEAGFRAWLPLVEPVLWRALRSFAPVVDVEAIVQEALLRMWTIAPVQPLEGENASLRFALRLVRNLAIDESRRRGREVPPDTDGTGGDDDSRDPLPPVAPAPPADPLLRRAILACIDKLPRQPKAALRARLDAAGAFPDRLLAERLAMQLNTFLQNVTRARRLVEECLAASGIAVKEYLR
jgi:RNA polymerase sigma-70 factor (ECF subfamily)